MFDKFGEFNTVEEINNVAADLKEKEKESELVSLALENGLDKEDAEDFYAGDIEELATVRTAAVGKLKVEAEDLELKGIVLDWKDSVVEMCMEDEQLCIAVRKKDKCLRDCMARLIRFAFENKVQISNKIVNATQVSVNGKVQPLRGPLYLGFPNKAEVKKIIKEYYVG